MQDKINKQEKEIKVMRIEIHRQWLGFKKFPTYKVNGKNHTRIFFMCFAITLVTI
jgi:hypothetical protein